MWKRFNSHSVSIFLVIVIVSAFICLYDAMALLNPLAQNDFHGMTFTAALNLILDDEIDFNNNNKYIQNVSDNNKNNNVGNVGRTNQQQQQRPISTELQKGALDFVLSRKQTFEQAGVAWKFKGLGYLYRVHYMILAAVTPDPKTKAGEIASIRLYDVHPKTLASGDGRQNCHEFTIWVRVRGPEVMAGKAKAVAATDSSSCYWTFDANLNTPGEYHVDAKILLYGAHNASVTEEQLEQCKREVPNHNITRPEQIAEIFPLHSGWKGFKVYYPKTSCCAFCTRLAPYCIYWASPPFALEDANNANNGCEFFFRPDTPKDWIPKSHLLDSNNNNGTVLWNLEDAATIQGVSYTKNGKFPFYHGTPYNNTPVHYFAGCGWSSWLTLDFPCLSGDLDDKVFMLDNSFFVGMMPDDSQKSTTTTAMTEASRRNLPLCTNEKERIESSKGRWIREPWPDTTVCPHEMKPDTNHSKHFVIMEHDPDRPHCWHRDDLRGIGRKCMELNCRFINNSSWYFSPLKNGTWHGVWRQDACDYLEFTDNQLQQCILDRKIKKFETRGASISQILKEYIDQRTEQMKFYNGTDQAITVLVDTLSLVHYGKSSDAKLEHDLKHFHPPVPTEKEEHYVVPAPFLSSEREIFVHVDRAALMNQMAQTILSPKGYKFLNLYDMSAAFTYDSINQMDGLHIVGPPMKMAITKLFHYLCKDVVEGSTV